MMREKVQFKDTCGIKLSLSCKWYKKWVWKGKRLTIEGGHTYIKVKYFVPNHTGVSRTLNIKLIQPGANKLPRQEWTVKLAKCWGEYLRDHDVLDMFGKIERDVKNVATKYKIWYTY